MTTSCSAVRSRLDRIYIPSHSWSASPPVSLPTNWSDHSLVWASCTILAPRVEIATAAPRLPNQLSLDRDPQFWNETLALWSSLCDGPITLERWSSFKQSVLKAGLSSRTRSSRAKLSSWKSTLRGDLVPEDDLHDALYRALRPPSLPRKPDRKSVV